MTDNAITPRQFAEWCKATELKHEESWNGSQYTENYHDSAKKAGVPEPWAKIINVLMFPGYADVWDWVEAQGVVISKA